MIPLGFDFESSTAQASPLYNQNAGIFFAGAGDANASGDVSPYASNQKAPTRQEAGGLNAFPESSLTPDFGLPNGGGNLLWYIVGGLLVIGLSLFAYKKFA